VKGVFSWYRSFRRLILKKDSYVHSSGWMKSLIEGFPCDSGGNVVPWMNYGIIVFLEKRLKKDMQLFEYGAGYSTQFYASLVSSVTSVEYDKSWFDKVSKNTLDNVEMLYRPLEKLEGYTGSILETKRKYHVVVIDGRDRVNCAKQALGCLTDDGVLIFDDTWREKYHDIFPYASKLGFKFLDFEGIKPGGSKNHRSTLIYRDGNCLGL